MNHRAAAAAAAAAAAPVPGGGAALAAPEPWAQLLAMAVGAFQERPDNASCPHVEVLAVDSRTLCVACSSTVCLRWTATEVLAALSLHRCRGFVAHASARQLTVIAKVKVTSATRPAAVPRRLQLQLNGAAPATGDSCGSEWVEVIAAAEGNDDSDSDSDNDDDDDAPPAAAAAVAALSEQLTLFVVAPADWVPVAMPVLRVSLASQYALGAAAPARRFTYSLSCGPVELPPGEPLGVEEKDVLLAEKAGFDLGPTHLQQGRATRTRVRIRQCSEDPAVLLVELSKRATGLHEVVAVRTDAALRVLQDIVGVSPRLLESVDAVAAQLLLHFNAALAPLRAAQYHPRSRLMTAISAATTVGPSPEAVAMISDAMAETMRAICAVVTRFTSHASLRFKEKVGAIVRGPASEGRGALQHPDFLALYQAAAAAAQAARAEADHSDSDSCSSDNSLDDEDDEATGVPVFVTAL